MLNLDFRVYIFFIERIPGAEAPVHNFSESSDEDTESPSSSPSSVSFDNNSNNSSNNNSSSNNNNNSNSKSCRPFEIDFCRQLPYNFTAFPNAMGHRDVGEAKDDIRRFK